MSNDLEDPDDREDLDSIDLKYQIYTDDPSLSVFIKFSGFDHVEQLSEFSEYIESYLPLILFDSDTKH